MYTGDDYAIYEELVGPYAPAVVTTFDPNDVDDDAVPVRAAPWLLDIDRRILRSRDLVWPDERTLSDDATLRLVEAIDNTRSVAELTELAIVSIGETKRQIASLYRDGWIVFRRVRSSGRDQRSQDG
jgi:hypothetical protein